MVAEPGWYRTVKSGLNPLAPVFIPGSVKQNVGKPSRDSSPSSDDRGFGQLPDAVKRLDTCLQSSATFCQGRAAGWTFCGAPQVLATVLSCLEDPKDVLACATACRHIRDIAEHAPLKLSVCSVSKSRQEVSILAQILQAIIRHFKGWEC